MPDPSSPTFIGPSPARVKGLRSTAGAADTVAPHVRTDLRVPADVIPIQYHAQMLLDDNRMDPLEQAIAVFRDASGYGRDLSVVGSLPRMLTVNVARNRASA